MLIYIILYVSFYMVFTFKISIYNKEQIYTE